MTACCVAAPKCPSVLGTSYFSAASRRCSAVTSGPEAPTRKPTGAGGGEVVVVVLVLVELVVVARCGLPFGCACSEDAPLHESATPATNATSGTRRRWLN